MGDVEGREVKGGARQTGIEENMQKGGKEEEKGEEEGG